MGGVLLLRHWLRQLALARAWLHLLICRLSPARSTILRDLARWIDLVPHRQEVAGRSQQRQLAWLLSRHPEFRVLFNYRIRRAGHWPTRCLLLLGRWLIPTPQGLWIACESIGPGLFIQHGYSTAIGGRRIGTNCWINQQVTVGHDRPGGRGPVIGDNVRLAAGAQVLGDVTIGDNCTVAPNSYVRRSVPDNCTVVGVPAVVVMREGRPALSELRRQRARRRRQRSCREGYQGGHGAAGGDDQ